MAAIDNLTPTTELEAVNAMLAINGVSPIDGTELATPTRADVTMAISLIRLVTKNVQSKGWHFNTDRLVTISLDGDDKAPVPTDALRVTKSRTEAQRDMDLAHRHGFLYDRVNNVYTFEADVIVDIVRALDFTEMPETARAYVFIVAGRRFQEQTIGNPEISGFAQKDEDAALKNLVDAEGLLEDTDYLENFPDQQMANKILRDVSKQVQTEGWKFNIRRNVGIEPNDDQEIVLPENTLRAVRSDIAGMALLDVAHRGTLMYNITDDTTVFDSTKLPDGVLYVDLFTYLDLDELPEAALKYIKIKAGRQIQSQRHKDQPEANGYTQQDESRALRTLQQAEGLPEDYNIFRSMDAARAVFRPSAFAKGRLRPRLGQF